MIFGGRIERGSEAGRMKLSLRCSDCCRAEFTVAGSGEGTHWHECGQCGRPCDVKLVCPVCMEPLSWNVIKGEPTSYCPDHGEFYIPNK